MIEPSKTAPACRRPKIAVVGGGISGLAAAERLIELLPDGDLTLFESAGRLGGVLDTVRPDGFLVERSADSFITKWPWAVDLCRRIGLSEDLLSTDESRRRAFVVRDGRVMPLPEGFVLMTPRRLWPILKSPVLSPLGKLRLLFEPCVPEAGRGCRTSGGRDDESVASFARRRLGRETFDRIVQPLLAGIYAADAERLSVEATVPEMVTHVARHGSLVGPICRRQARDLDDKRKSLSESGETGARYGMFVAPRLGMGSMIDALSAGLPPMAVRLQTRVVRVVKGATGGWHVFVESCQDPETYDAVVIATPAPIAAQMLRHGDDELALSLAEIPYVGSTVVSLCLRREQIRHPLDGFGVVVPRIEGRQIFAMSFASVKFAGRAPKDCEVVRVFVGGALQAELANLPDGKLLELVQRELATLIGLRGRPLWTDVARWPQSMPQYHVGHLDRVARLEHLVAGRTGLELAGNAYRGVGIPQCIHSGQQAAERIAEWIKSGSPGRFR